MENSERVLFKIDTFILVTIRDGYKYYDSLVSRGLSVQVHAWW